MYIIEINVNTMYKKWHIFDYLEYIPLILSGSWSFICSAGPGPAALAMRSTIKPLVCVFCFPTWSNPLKSKLRQDSEIWHVKVAQHTHIFVGSLNLKYGFTDKKIDTWCLVILYNIWFCIISWLVKFAVFHIFLLVKQKFAIYFIFYKWWAKNKYLSAKQRVYLAVFRSGWRVPTNFLRCIATLENSSLIKHRRLMYDVG